MKLANLPVDAVEANGVGVPHGAAAPGRKAVAVDIDNVDIGSPQGKALLEDFCAFVDEGVDRALDDFLRRNCATRDAGGAGAVGENGLDFRIGQGCATPCRIS